MEVHTKIGKSIIQMYADNAKQNPIDDETEFFPTLKVIIKGITESY